MTIEGSTPAYPGTTIAYSAKYARRVVFDAVQRALQALWDDCSRLATSIECDDEELLHLVGHALFSDASMTIMTVGAAGRPVLTEDQVHGITGAAGIVIYCAHRLVDLQGRTVDSALAYEHHKRIVMAADIVDAIGKELRAEIEACP